MPLDEEGLKSGWQYGSGAARWRAAVQALDLLQTRSQIAHAGLKLGPIRLLPFYLGLNLRRRGLPLGLPFRRVHPLQGQRGRRAIDGSDGNHVCKSVGWRFQRW